MTKAEVFGCKSGEKMFVCQNCDARTGCHKGTDKALGCLADEELRKLRQAIHARIDGAWDDPRSRQALYKELGKRYGAPFHVGFMNNEKARWVLYDLNKNPLPLKK